MRHTTYHGKARTKHQVLLLGQVARPPLLHLKANLTYGMDPTIVLMSDELRVGEFKFPKVSKWQRWDLNSGQNNGKTHADSHHMLQPWLKEGTYSL